MGMGRQADEFIIALFGHYGYNLTIILDLVKIKGSIYRFDLCNIIG